MFQVRGCTVDEAVPDIPLNPPTKILPSCIFFGTVHHGSERVGRCSAELQSVTGYGYRPDRFIKPSGYLL